MCFHGSDCIGHTVNARSAVTRNSQHPKLTQVEKRSVAASPLSGTENSVLICWPTPWPGRSAPEPPPRDCFHHRETVGATYRPAASDVAIMCYQMEVWR